MINKRQGDTIKKEIEIYNEDGSPANLDGVIVTAGISQKKESGGYEPIASLIPYISGNAVGVRYEETSEMLGLYELEIKLTDITNDVETIERETITIWESILR